MQQGLFVAFLVRLYIAIHSGRDVYLSKKAMEYLVIPEKMDNQIRIKYKDKNIKIPEVNEEDGSITEKDLEAEYDMYIVSMNPRIQFGTPVSYTVVLKKVNQQEI